MEMGQSTSDITDDELLEALGCASSSANDITVLRHVRSHVERHAAAMIAEHTPCADFDNFHALFVQVTSDLEAHRRTTSRFRRYTGICAGDYFILGGQIVYVAEVGATIQAPGGGDDARLRLIYANGTESNLLLRSLQRALYKDSGGRRISGLA